MFATTVPNAGKAYKNLVDDFVASAADLTAATQPKLKVPGLTAEETLFISAGIDISLEQYVPLISYSLHRTKGTKRRVSLRARIESFQRARQNKGATTETAKGLLSARRTLRSRVDAWCATHEDVMPELNRVAESEDVDEDELNDVAESGDDDEAEDEPGLAEEDEDDADTSGVPLNGPEKEVLFLPSDLDSASFEAGACGRLGGLELKLRRALAYDVLDQIKLSLSLKAATIQSKARNARGTRNNIGAQAEVTQANENVVHLAKKYNDNLDRMKKLSTLLQSSPFHTTISTLR